MMTSISLGSTPALAIALEPACTAKSEGFSLADANLRVLIPVKFSTMSPIFLNPFLPRSALISFVVISVSGRYDPHPAIFEAWMQERRGGIDQSSNVRGVWMAMSAASKASTSFVTIIFKREISLFITLDLTSSTPALRIFVSSSRRAENFMPIVVASEASSVCVQNTTCPTRLR